jgi:hypothetical protein
MDERRRKEKKQRSTRGREIKEVAALGFDSFFEAAAHAQAQRTVV